MIQDEIEKDACVIVPMPHNEARWLQAMQQGFEYSKADTERALSFSQHLFLSLQQSHSKSFQYLDSTSELTQEEKAFFDTQENKTGYFSKDVLKPFSVVELAPFLMPGRLASDIPSKDTWLTHRTIFVSGFDPAVHVRGHWKDMLVLQPPPEWMILDVDWEYTGDHYCGRDRLNPGRSCLCYNGSMTFVYVVLHPPYTLGNVLRQVEAGVIKPRG